MRKSIREFAALLGVETTTITNWRSGLSAVTPRSGTQAILDTTYQQRATPEDRDRFEQIVAEGEAAWRERHGLVARTEQPAQDTSDRDRSLPSKPSPMHLLPGDAGPPTSDGDSGKSLVGAGHGADDDLIDVLSRVHKLSRSVNAEVIQHLQRSTVRSIARYETLEPADLVATLRKQRRWIDQVLNECSHPQQRRRLFEIASETSGLLGYIAVGRGNFPLARAYCLEAFQLGDYAEDSNLMAWVRGMQSFCEYYAGHYAEAVQYAQDGLAQADSGPQSVRLAVNGLARALGKLGDVEGVHQAVDYAYDLVSRNEAPDGVPSSISLESYSPAQVAGNAATAYLSLAMPDRVERYVELALPEMSDDNSPWGRSLVMIDLARSHVVSAGGDLDAATGIMIDALDISAGTPMMQVRRRASEFVEDATARWGDASPLRAVRDVLASVTSLDINEQTE
ncbi:hypothetical protein ACWEKR_32195 [Nocardia sp. NPDC004573]